MKKFLRRLILGYQCNQCIIGNCCGQCDGCCSGA